MNEKYRNLDNQSKMTAGFVIENNMDKIEEGVYLGNDNAEKDLQTLLDANIKIIISVLTDFEPSHKQFKYTIIPALDLPTTNLIQYFDQTNKIISESIKNKENILIHCAAGQSRSVTILAAFLMKSRGLSRVDALNFIRASRPQIKPNDGFIAQLDLYQKLNYIVNTDQPLYRRFLNSLAMQQFR
ncbi:hypothetical protein BB560_001184, partial [Smittium megazygosporum]